MMTILRPVATWRDAFGLGPREHIALVGGGGKTTTLWSMGKELARSARTIVTSTTKAGAPPPGVPLVFWDEGSSPVALLAPVAAALEKSSLIAVGSAIRKERLQSVPAAVADYLFTDCEAAYVLNEADGARMLPFKAPAEYEPALALTTTLAIIVVGLDALRRPIADGSLHRPERIVALTGANIGDRLVPNHVAMIARHYLRKIANSAPEARAGVLINKADVATGASDISDLASAITNLGLSAVAAAGQLGDLRLWRVT